MVDALQRSMGAAGCAELVARAFARSEETNPILKVLREAGGDCTRLDDIASSVATHGREAVTAAITALLTAVIDILTRLIGEEMATQLVTGDDVQPASRAGSAA